MRKFFIFILYIILSLSNLQGQINGFDPNSFLIGGKYISLFEKSKGNTIKTKIDNTIPDNYFEAQILKKENNRFYVKIHCVNCNDSILIGWVNAKYLGVGFRNKASFDSIPIFDFPDNNSRSNTISTHIESVLAKVVDIDGKWVKVTFFVKSKKIIGWLSPENQCYNLFTMCTGE